MCCSTLNASMIFCHIAEATAGLHIKGHCGNLVFSWDGQNRNSIGSTHRTLPLRVSYSNTINASWDQVVFLTMAPTSLHASFVPQSITLASSEYKHSEDRILYAAVGCFLWTTISQRRSQRVCGRVYVRSTRARQQSSFCVFLNGFYRLLINVLKIKSLGQYLEEALNISRSHWNVLMVRRHCLAYSPDMELDSTRFLVRSTTTHTFHPCVCWAFKIHCTDSVLQ